MDCLTEMAIYALGDLCCNLLAVGLADGFAVFAGYKARRERTAALRRGEKPPSGAPGATFSCFCSLSPSC